MHCFEERFWDKVNILDDFKCWEWKASVDTQGYGRFWLNKEMKKAHRISFLIKNYDPKEKYVLHSCDNKICVNPNHLFLGNHLDNMKDRQNKNRDFLCGIRTKKSSLIKLNEDGVREILYLLKEGTKTQRQISKLMNISQPTISLICQRKIWKNIKI